MTTPTIAADAPAAGLTLRAASLPARLISVFSGTVGLVIKLAFLAVVNAIALWGAIVLGREEKWVALTVLVLATAALDAVYLIPGRAIPLKFLLPGTVFLIAFQVIPIVYNANVALSNWSTGHLLTKAEAVQTIENNSLTPPADARSYVMAPAHDSDGELVLVLVEETTGEAFIGTREGLEPLAASEIESEAGVINSVEGYTLAKPNELLALDKELSGYIVPSGGSRAIRPEGLDIATELEPTLRYDEAQGEFVRLRDGARFRDNSRGSFVAAGGEELEPGWRTNVGIDNFRRIVEDELIRRPFVRVFIWTFGFATGTVFVSFALGLFLAIALNKPGMRFLRTYRSLLVLPYAVPAFLSILVWSGLLNDEFGLVNRLLPQDVPWLFDANWAKVSVLIVSVWLTFPYFFLVSLGALQSIPDELVEAARVDGGGPLQIFRRVTLPLLLVAVAPLLIASFAFNFNNFNIIYLLTKGQPTVGDQGVAGATDILISYTWKLAFEAGKGQDYGLASAISIVIFFIVASISAASFWKSRSLEELR
jgi:arabinogalactan oligomer / maltooligosaccharide transport system permease protein